VALVLGKNQNCLTKNVIPRKLKNMSFWLIYQFQPQFRHNLYILIHDKEKRNQNDQYALSTYIQTKYLFLCFRIDRVFRFWSPVQTVSATNILVGLYYLKSPGGRHVCFGIYNCYFSFLYIFFSCSRRRRFNMYNHIIPRYIHPVVVVVECLFPFPSRCSRNLFNDRFPII